MTPVRADGPLVIGLGSPDRGDDAVGATVARAVAGRLSEVEVVDHEDPTALLEIWAGHTPVVVVDAVHSQAPAGTLRVLETGQSGAPLVAGSWAPSGLGGSHAVGLVEMVELGRALGRLPERLVVVGVEGECWDHGAPLSPAVAAVVPDAVARVCDLLEASSRKEPSDVPQ